MEFQQANGSQFRSFQHCCIDLGDSRCRKFPQRPKVQLLGGLLVRHCLYQHCSRRVLVSRPQGVTSPRNIRDAIVVYRQWSLTWTSCAVCCFCICMGGAFQLWSETCLILLMWYILSSYATPVWEAVRSVICISTLYLVYLMISTWQLVWVHDGESLTNTGIIDLCPWESLLYRFSK